MKKYFIPFILIVFLFSCKERYGSEINQIEKFESVLKETERNYLDEIVLDFNMYLDSKYDTGSSIIKFKKYLTDLSVNKLNDVWKLDSIKHKEYYTTSNLFSKYDSIYPDSVWYNKGMFDMKFKEFELIESRIPLTRNINIDSMINTLKREPRLRNIAPSRFYIALDSVKQGDSLIINYLDAVEMGNLPPSILANGLLGNFNNNSDYFSKRIFVMEVID